MKRNDIIEKSSTYWECPVCGEINDMCEEPNSEDELVCYKCQHCEPLED